MLHHINELYEIKGQKGIYEFEAIKNLPWIAVRKASAMSRGEEIKVYQADGSYKIAYLYGKKLGLIIKQKLTIIEKQAKNKRKKQEQEKY